MTWQTTGSVLIVDGVLARLRALGALLRPLGLDAVSASSDEEARLQADRHAPAVVLYSAELPGVLEAARSFVAPVIVLGAVDAAAAYRAGAVDVLPSPADPEVLKAKLRVFARLDRQRRAHSDAEHDRDAAESANRAKDEFLAIVSHELRTPLNAILGWAEMARTGRLDPERQAHALDTIVRNARVQSQLIGELLDLSRIAAGKFHVERRPGRLEPIVRTAVDSVRPQATQKGVTLSLELNAAHEEVELDSQRLQQVVTNLLHNAVKFTPAGGRVDVELASVENAVEIRVRDSGRGIAAEFLPHVFDRFRQANTTGTREHGGLGLGLAIVRHIIERHEGQVTAFSDGVDRGATFVVRLPRRGVVVNVPEAIAPESSSRVTSQFPLVAAEAPTLQGLRVLVVDDEEDARDVLEALLTAHGAEVVLAPDVATALTAVEQQRFDLVVSDLAMPHADGFQLARKLSGPSGVPPMPLVALSAYAAGDDKARALEAGFVSHVSKPVDPATLVALLDRLAHGRDRRRHRRLPARTTQQL